MTALANLDDIMMSKADVKHGQSSDRQREKLGILWPEAITLED